MPASALRRTMASAQSAGVVNWNQTSLLLTMQHAPDERHGVEVLDDGQVECWHGVF